MSYVNYEREADNHRKQSARSYYDSRKYARKAADEYRHAIQQKRNAEFFAHFRPHDIDNPAAKCEEYLRTIIRLADTYLDSSFHATERARFYAQLARDYDELAERSRERLGV